MRKKLLLFGLIFSVLVVFATDFSCKKNSQEYLSTLLTDGQWQLSTMQVTYFTGASTDSTVQRDTLCNLTQSLKFNADNSCTFANYDCEQQTGSGHWSMSANKLYLYSDISVDSAGVKTTPFKNAQIQNLGQYSLVLQTGDLEQYYPPTMKRVITRYGFVRVKSQ